MNIKRALALTLALIALTVTACQAPDPAPSPSAAPTPVTSDTPPSPPKPEFTFVLPEPDKAPTPGPPSREEGILGEWAGYISMAESDFLYSAIGFHPASEAPPTYAAKLTLSESGAWLSLDLLTKEQDLSFTSPDMLAPMGNFGASLNVLELNADAVTLKIADYAYAQHDAVPYEEGSAFVLAYHHVDDGQELSDSEIFQHTPAHVPTASNDMLYGKLGEWTISFARLSEGPGEDHTYPYWYGYEGIADGVRGAYGFGERGADNDFSTLVFVYSDAMGFEHIRMLYGDFSLPGSLKGRKCFVSWSPLMELGVSFMATPWWAKCYALSAETGVFTDVSEQNRAFYRDERLPSVKQSLIYSMYAHRPDGEVDDEYDQIQLEYDRKHYALVYEAAYGMRPDAMPELREPAVNSNTVFADIDDDGDADSIEIMFFNTLDESSKEYDAAWFRVNGVWRYTVMPGYGASGQYIYPDFTVVDFDSEGAVVALEIASDSGTRVELYRLYDQAAMADICNDTLWGGVLGETQRVVFHGGGRATGFRRSAFSVDIIVTYEYSSEGGFLNLDWPEDGLFAAKAAKPLVLGAPLFAYLERDMSSRAISLYPSQEVFPIASDEGEWLKMHSASGQVFWVHCESEEDYPRFKLNR